MKVSCQKNFNIPVSLPYSVSGIYFSGPDGNPATKNVLWKANIDGTSPAIVSSSVEYSSTYYNMVSLEVSADNGFVYFSYPGCEPPFPCTPQFYLKARRCTQFDTYSNLYNGTSSSNSIAVDDVNQMIYFEKNGQLWKGGLNGSFPSPSPYWTVGPYPVLDIALDTTNSMVYWACADAVRRSSMSSGPTEIVGSGAISLTLDVPNGKVFWLLNSWPFRSLYSANLDGTSAHYVNAFPNATISKIRQYGGKIYACASAGLNPPFCNVFVNPWIHRMNEDGSAWTALISAPAGFDTCGWSIPLLSII